MLENVITEAIFRDRKINKYLLLFLSTLLCKTAWEQRLLWVAMTRFQHWSWLNAPGLIVIQCYTSLLVSVLPSCPGVLVTGCPGLWPEELSGGFCPQNRDNTIQSVRSFHLLSFFKGFRSCSLKLTITMKKMSNSNGSFQMSGSMP